MANREDMSLDWDSSLTKEDVESANQLLPDGEYYFRVIKFEKARFNGSAKMQPSPMAKVTIEVSFPDEMQNVWTENLILNKICIWKAHQFFQACGLIGHGYEGVLPWGRILGASGRAKVSTRTYDGKDGEKKKANQVDRWLPPEAEDTGKEEEY